MDMMADDDEVIAEIPVYYRNCSSHQIGLINFPLRPRHKPYDGPDLGSLHQVQMKPQHGALQFQYRKDRRRDEEPGDARVFTLSSSRVQPKSTYAIGRISNGQLHLVPIDQVYSMVPDFAAVDAAAAASKAAMRGVDIDADAVETKAAPKEVLLRAAQTKTQSGETTEIRKSYQMLRQEFDSEKWTLLHVNSEDSSESVELRQSLSHIDMEECERIPMDVPLPAYLSSLCSGTDVKLSSAESGLEGASNDSSSSLQARCIHVLKNAGVMQFGELCDVLRIPDDDRDDVVKILVARCILVQNCWVPKSSLLLSGRASIARDYLLQLFSNNRELKLTDWTSIAQLDLQTSLQIIQSLATLNKETKQWVFKCEFDYDFGASYEGVVAEQNRAFLRIDALNQLTGVRSSAAEIPKKTSSKPEKPKQHVAEETLDVKMENADVHTKPKTSVKTEPNVSVSAVKAEKVQVDPEIQYFVSQQLEQFGVITLSSLLTTYRSKGKSVTEAVMTAALNNTARPFVGSGYCRKTIDANDESLEMFRNAFIEMYRAAPSKSFRKSDIKNEIQQRTNVELPEKNYSRLTKELGRLVKGSWIAKTGE